MNGKGARERLEGAEGGEIITRIYCVRKESIFNKRKISFSTQRKKKQRNKKKKKIKVYQQWAPIK